MHYLEFERPIAELEEGKIVELRRLAEEDSPWISMAKWRDWKAAPARWCGGGETYAHLTPCRSSGGIGIRRAAFSGLCRGDFESSRPWRADSSIRRGSAVVAELARFAGGPSLSIGQERGNDTQSRLKLISAWRCRKAIEGARCRAGGTLRVAGAVFCGHVGRLSRRHAEDAAQPRPCPLDRWGFAESAVHRQHHRRRRLRRRHRHAPPPTVSICWNMRSIR